MLPVQPQALPDQRQIVSRLHSLLWGKGQGGQQGRRVRPPQVAHHRRPTTTPTPWVRADPHAKPQCLGIARVCQGPGHGVEQRRGREVGEEGEAGAQRERRAGGQGPRGAKLDGGFALHQRGVLL